MKPGQNGQSQRSITARTEVSQRVCHTNSHSNKMSRDRERVGNSYDWDWLH